jgi:hypothetical protein
MRVSGWTRKGQPERRNPADRSFRATKKAPALPVCLPADQLVTAELPVNQAEPAIQHTVWSSNSLPQQFDPFLDLLNFARTIQPHGGGGCRLCISLLTRDASAQDYGRL